jgi:hypothetical protein
MTHYAIRRIFAGPLGSSLTMNCSAVVAIGVDPTRCRSRQQTPPTLSCASPHLK